MEKKEKKPIIFFQSHEEQMLHGRMKFLNMSYAQRLQEMYRLNKKIYGPAYGDTSKNMSFFIAIPGETITEFFERINKR